MQVIVLQNAPMEHSAVLLTCIKIPNGFQAFVLSIFEWPLKTGFTVLVLFFSAQCQMMWHHPLHQVLIHCLEPWYQLTRELINMFYTSPFFYSPVPDDVAPPPAPSPNPLPGTLVSTHTGIKKHAIYLYFLFQPSAR